MENNIKQDITRIVQSIHRIEVLMGYLAVFEKNLAGEGFIPTSLNYAYKEIIQARMFGGDVARVLILGNNIRTDKRFIPKDHGLTFDGQFSLEELQMSEFELIQAFKKELRGLFYELMDNNYNIAPGLKLNIYNEYLLYLTKLTIHLKQADQWLGIRLGKIYPKAKAQ